MQKGYAGAILLFAVIVTAALLISLNNTTRENYSYKEIVLEMKTTISSYETTLNFMTRNCDWENEDPMIVEACVYDYSHNLKDLQNANNAVKCGLGDSFKNEGSYYSMNLDCNAQITSKTGSIKIDANKIIKIYPPSPAPEP